MAGDWLKLHRKALDSRAFSDDWLWRLWCWCLMKASWKSSWKDGREILPGQFVTSRNQAANWLNVSPSKWYRGMQTLQEWRQIRMEVNSLGTVVTVCNWETYQGEEVEKWTADEQPMNSQRTADEQPMNSSYIGDEEREEKKEVKKVCSPPSRFQKPTIDQVREYCQERANGIDPEHFVSYYEARGWRLKDGPMRNWKAAVITWEKNRFNGKPATKQDNSLWNYDPPQ